MLKSVTLLFALALVLGCESRDRASLLRAKRIETRSELIGGPLAHGQPGDYLIENDVVRFVISGAHHSWGPGLFGGTVVDADLRRWEPGYRSGQGKDQFAEMFPTVNLVVPDPTASEITVVSDGSDGQQAKIEVRGKGILFLQALSVLDTTNPKYGNILGALGVKTQIDFVTTYTLRPGSRVLELETVARRPDSDFPATCPPLDCKLTCPTGLRFDPVLNCPKCACDDPEALKLPLFTEPVPLLSRIVGDELADGYGEADALRPGYVAGDFLFFGGHQDIFAPGLGFDEKGKVFENLFRGVDTITSPLTFDWIASSGDDVSYAVFSAREPSAGPAACTHRLVLSAIADPTKREPVVDALGTLGLPAKVGSAARARWLTALNFLVEQKLPVVLYRGLSESERDQKKAAADTALAGLATVTVDTDGDCRTPRLLAPLFTASATMVASAGTACKAQDPADDATCDERRSFRFKRYLAVGDGDVASAAKLVYEARGVPHGELTGIVFDESVGRALHRADVFAVADPDPKHETEYATFDLLLAANQAARANTGIETHTKADAGIDPRRTGRYRLTVPEGHWWIVARSPDGVVSRPQRAHVTAGAEIVLHPTVPAPAKVHYRVTEPGRGPVPAKLTFQALGTDGQPLWADGKRRPSLGEGRLDDGVFHIEYSATGEGTTTLEAGRYRVTVSRGIEYSIDQRELTLSPGGSATLDAALRHEVNSSGYITGDFHLHAEPSFDSGMGLDLRVITNVVEGIELLSSSDHDAVTDYAPIAKKLGLDRFAMTQVGEEVSTIETGHYLGFPLAFDWKNIPVHAAIDWVCKPIGKLFEEIRALGEFGADSTVITVAHPRDGFLGYFDQFGLNPWTLERGEGGLEADNPTLRTLSCDFDALELMNGRRYDLYRTPTVLEVNDSERCQRELNAARSNGEVRAACPWLKAPKGCEGTPTTDQKNARGEPCAWTTELTRDFELCRDEDSSPTCRDKARNAVTTVILRRMLHRTIAEQEAWNAAFAAPPLDNNASHCSPATLDEVIAGKKTLTPAEELAPCGQQQGSIDDWFQLLNHGLRATAMGNSDSHGTDTEPGLPRNFVASSTDDARHIDRREVAENIKKGKVVSSTGPFVHVTLDGAGPGETVSLASGAGVTLRVRVETPSWFGVDRLEIYRNGALEREVDLAMPASAIVDYDNVIELPRPTEDSWYVVIAQGLRQQDFLNPVYIRVPLGDLALNKITAIAFANLTVIKAIVGTSSLLPDYYPPVPYAIVNPIYVDVDGGGFKAKGERPAFCSRPCTPVQGAKDEKDGKLGWTQADCPNKLDVCFPNTTVGLSGAAGTCGRAAAAKCEPFDGQKTVTGALRTGEDATPEARAPQTKRLMHDLGRYLLNAFIHPLHTHAGE